MFRALTITLLAACALPAFAQAPLDRYVVNNAVNRNAVCNDGSRAIYYVRPGTGENARRWHIHLKGGRSCVDTDDCRTRWPNQNHGLMSSGCFDASCSAGARPASYGASQWQPQETFQGIFDDRTGINPYLRDWTHVFVVYCSSDNWLGDTQQPFDDTGLTGWDSAQGDFIDFRGNVILQAVLEDLQNPAFFQGDANLANAHGVLLSGSSAGAAGLRHQLDRVADTLAPMPVRGLSDAGLDLGRPIDMSTSPAVITCGARFDPTTFDPATQKQEENFKYWGAVAGLDESCKAAHPTAPEDCMGALTLLEENELTTPFMVWSNQLDSIPLGDFRDLANAQLVQPVTDPPGLTINECFARSMRQNLRAALDHVTAMERLVSPCLTGVHVGLKDNETWARTLVERTLYFEMLGRWLYDLPSAVESVKLAQFCPPAP